MYLKNFGHLKDVAASGENRMLYGQFSIGHCSWPSNCSAHQYEPFYSSRLCHGLLEKQVECLWKLDKVPCVTNSIVPMSKEDHYALHLMNTSKRFVDGHYQLRLPRKPGGPQLPDNRQQAVTRLSYLKRRLEKDPVLKDKYSAVIMEYLSQGYARKVDDNENQTNVKWCLCHPVFHPQNLIR